MRLVLCSCPPEAADEIARVVVEKGFAACVNVVAGVRRTAPADEAGEAVVTDETLLVIQTGQDDLDKMYKQIAKLHPVAPPPVVSLRIFGGDPDYVDWAESKRPAGGAKRKR